MSVISKQTRTDNGYLVWIRVDIFDTIMFRSPTKMTEAEAVQRLNEYNQSMDIPIEVLVEEIDAQIASLEAQKEELLDESS